MKLQVLNNFFPIQNILIQNPIATAPQIFRKNENKIVLKGDIPSPINPPSGCVFRTRCPHASPNGKEAKIEMGLIEVEPGHWVDRCGANCS